jgi:polysaccharide chain length determinant protein (PEP-CTERM system associated)
VNTPALEWSSAPEPQPSPLLALVPVIRHELTRHAAFYAGIFAAIALCALVAGLLLPKKYASTSTILVEQSNIIAPLMEGRAVPTSVANRALIAREVAFSRRVMGEILKAGGWMAGNPSPVVQDRLIEDIKSRIVMSNPRENLIQIRYVDSDPQRAYEVTRNLANLVISESLANKERESRDAYAFIDSQVAEYHQKLVDAETKLEAYRDANPDSRTGNGNDVNSRIGELRRIIETGQMDLIDQRSQASALQSQLSGESEVTLVQTRAGQIRARLAELQADRDRLLLQYTDRHPDVVRVQHEIADLQEELRQEEAKPRVAVNGQSLDGPAAFNPLYGELKSKLADVRRASAATSARIAAAQAMLADEIGRSQRIDASENKLAELTRDYEVNRDLYQDLLKRRENARVSMNLDAEQRGLTFRIQEPAVVPLRPVGLRLVHIAGAGLGAALLAPMLLLFGVAKFDPRVRSPLQIERGAGLPVLGSVPMYVTPQKRRHLLKRLAFAATLPLLVVAAYGTVFALKLVHAL